jgi:hypothetical protein
MVCCLTIRGYHLIRNKISEGFRPLTSRDHDFGKTFNKILKIKDKWKEKPPRARSPKTKLCTYQKYFEGECHHACVELE